LFDNKGPDMSLPHSPAVLLLSIATDAATHTTAPQRTCEESVEGFAQFLSECGLAATWISHSPADWPYSAKVSPQRGRQELALCAARGSDTIVGRQSLGEELRRQIVRLRAAGCGATTLFAADNLSTQQHELLAKYGVTAVCAMGDTGTLARPSALRLANRWLLPMAARSLTVPQKLRWGLWQMPQGVHLAREGARQVRNCIDRTVAESGITHLHVDLMAINNQGSRAFDQVTSVLRQVASYADRGRLRAQTMGETAARLSRPKVTVPACSILRKAAA
jgi:hypothetical protein